MSLASRLANALWPERLRRELDDEIAFHLDERIQQLMATGLSREAAARQAACQFGSRLRTREQSTEVRLMPWIESVIRDIRLAVRVHWRNAPVTIAAILSLALALGASIAAFALIEALILRPLPVREPERLVYLTFRNVNRAGVMSPTESSTFADPMFLRLRDAGRAQVTLFAMSTQVLRRVSFDSGEADMEEVRSQFTSGDAFTTLGVGPSAGRLFTADDDRTPGAHQVAVLSHDFWQRRFGGDPSVVGRWLNLQEGPLQLRPFQIVGVAERTFSGVEPGRPTDLWFPYAMYNPRAFGSPQFNWFRIFGRLNDGVTAVDVQNVLQPVFAEFRRAHHGFGPGESPDVVARFSQAPFAVRSAENGPSPLRTQFERPLLILAGIALLVLVIAGSNVANLFLARTRAREHEMSLRLSIGAGRGRLVQQILIETGLVAAAAGVLGLLFAGIAAPALVRALASPDDPVSLDLAMNWRVAGLVAGSMILLTALFGTAPALGASHVAPMTTLRAGGSRTVARTGVMRPFVAIQVAFSLAILFVGGLLVTSFERLVNLNPGFVSSNVLLLSVQPGRPADPLEQRVALGRVLARLREVPGVESATSADFNLIGRAWTKEFRVPNLDGERLESTMAPVMPGFFETMGIPLLAGRTFSEQEGISLPARVVVVNQAFANRYFGDVQAIGRTVNSNLDDTGERPHEVVGIVADTRHSLRETPEPTLYFPMWLRTNGTIHVRASGNAQALSTRLRAEVRAADPMFRVLSVTTQQAVVDRTLVRERLLALLSGFFAVVGLVLAAVGLYGVLSYSVVRRTREIGVRVALGGSRLTVVRSVMTDVGVTTLIGAALGLGGGIYLAQYVDSLLYEVRPFDVMSVAVPVGGLLVAATAAAALPALRATRIDPVVALRED
jgi:predicted permease